MAYTYEDFLTKKASSGIGDEQWSEYDLELAKRYPEAGMSLLSLKQSYASATTDEARALANAQAERIRRQYGNYEGGKNGLGYVVGSPAPNSFTYEDAPSYAGKYDGEIGALRDELIGTPAYSSKYEGTLGTLRDDIVNTPAYSSKYESELGSLRGDIVNTPAYSSKYGERLDSLMESVMNHGDFSYDATKDPLYSQYKKQAKREGERATANAIGEAAGATGGIPSSYAVSAAAQAGNYYAAQLADKLPELERYAYEKYLNDYDMKKSKLGIMQGAEEIDYGRYLDDYSMRQGKLDVIERADEIDYGRYLDDYSMRQGKLDVIERADEIDYGRYLDDYSMRQSKLEAMRQADADDYAKYLTQLEQYNADRNFAYGQHSDQIAHLAEREAAEEKRAQLALENQWYIDEVARKQAQQELENKRYDEALAAENKRYDDERAYNRGQDALENRLYNDEIARQLEATEYERRMVESEEEYNRMAERWKMLGYADDAVASYFGIDVGMPFGGAAAGSTSDTNAEGVSYNLIANKYKAGSASEEEIAELMGYYEVASENQLDEVLGVDYTAELNNIDSATRSFLDRYIKGGLTSNAGERYDAQSKLSDMLVSGRLTERQLRAWLKEVGLE